MQHKTVFSILIFYLMFAYINIQSKAQSKNYTFRHLSSRDGMKNSYITRMVHDQQGMIWIAGNNGLDRYDGNTIINYRHNALDKNSIPRGHVRDILEIDSGRMWVGASKLAIMNLASGTSKTIALQKELPQIKDVNAIIKDSKGDIWVGDDENGIYHIPVQNFEADTLAGYLYPTGKKVIPEVRNRELNIAVLRLAERGDGTILAGTIDGLYIFDKETKSITKAGPFKPEIEAMLSRAGNIWDMIVDSNNNLWISTKEGLIIWRTGAAEPEQIKSIGKDKSYPLDQYIQSLVEDNERYIWIGTGLNGCYRYNPSTGDVTEFRNKAGDLNSISYDDVHYAFKDRFGNHWFGYHDIGISMMYEESWNYSYRLAVNDKKKNDLVNGVKQILEDEKENLWIATVAGIVFQSKNGKMVKQFQPFTEENANSITSIVWHDKKLLVTTSRGKIALFDPVNEKYTHIDVPEDVTRLWNIVEDKNNFYVGSTISGMLVIKKKDLKVRWILNPSNDPENTEKISMIPLIDIKGNIWVEAIMERSKSEVSLNYYLLNPSDLTFTDLNLSFTLADYFGPPSISSTQPGVIWRMTADGISRHDLINKERTIIFQTEVANHSLHAGVIEDAKGILYSAGDDGAARYDPGSGSYTMFTGNGDQRPTAFAWPQLMRNGDLIVSGRGGFVRLDPKVLVNKGSIQAVHLLEIRNSEQRFSPTYESFIHPKFNHSDNNIFISYIGLNFRDPSSTIYRYRIKGYQNEWLNVGKQQQLMLAGMPPGEYEFQLQAATENQGFTDEATKTFTFTILPPWWKTTGAYFGYGFFAVTLVLGIDRLQRRRIREQEREHAREKELSQAREIEKAYTELKATQSQLIQSEKMASLGELTAGIAHEIQNPLNFVNNFSEVNTELIEELKSESAKPKAEWNETFIRETIDNLSDNEHKIVRHGKRADAIVKSMLQHSRTSSGKKELTDMNALCDEYLRLSYHGLRAKDKSFNAKFECHLDPTLPKVNVVSQDIGRVILNLINNAFYAVSEKQKVESLKSGSGFEPTVIVSTKNLGDKIEICVKDNGTGIPEHIKEKIFQPFFTTKPTGQGTGLGLSLSYDIVKSHGGEIILESQPNKGSIFTIHMPVNQ